MKKSTKIWILVFAIGIVVCWAILAFLLNEDLIPRFSLFSSLIIGTVATITSIIALIISCLSYKNLIDEKNQKRVDEAKLFLHDNNDEIDFLPYCVYASCYDRHGHHTRKIYNEFCRLTDEMQREVLKQANYKLEPIETRDWIADKINLIDKFAEEYGFGDTFLYDSGKHFLNGYKTKEELYVDEPKEELRDVFGMYGFPLRMISRKGITIDQYFEGYGYRKFRDPKWLDDYDYAPPGDLLIEIKELRNVEKTSSAVVAFWMCHEIENLFYIIAEYFYGKVPDGVIVNDAQPKYFEDKFYMILNLLYCLDDYSKYKVIIKEPYDKKAREELIGSEKTT